MKLNFLFKNFTGLSCIKISFWILDLLTPKCIELVVWGYMLNKLGKGF